MRIETADVDKARIPQRGADRARERRGGIAVAARGDLIGADDVNDTFGLALRGE